MVKFRETPDRRCSLHGALASIVLAMAMFAILTVPRLAIAGEASSLLDGNHPDEAADLATDGNAPASRQLKMRITLALNHRGDLERLLDDQQDPSSPAYHQWLKPDEFTRRFGPTDAQIAKVSRWIRQSGFAVESSSAATRSIVFTGTVAQAEKAFGVKIAGTADGATYANTTDPAIPADLTPLIDSIQGLDNMLNVVPQVHRRSGGSTTSASAPNATVDGQGPAFGPADQYTFYNQTPLLDSGIDGTGADCIALIEDSNIDTPSLDAFNAQFGLPAFNGANFARTFPTTDPGINGDDLEALVDINYSHATAPGTPINVYIGNQSNPTRALGILDAMVKAVNDNRCGAISISFGICGGNKKFYRSLDGLFAQANSQGQSVFVASGDIGSAGLAFNKRTKSCVPTSKPQVVEIAASPHVSAIGGTQFNANFDGGGNDVGFVAESVWNDSFGASGGGKSKIFKKPAFQQGVTPKKDKKRDIPDISIAASPASPGYFFGESGAVNCCVGGTSVGTPIWAGIAQLIAESKSASRVGNINRRLYQLGSGGSTAIRDVTAGNNHFGSTPGFNAGPGFDLATGWGTPDIAAFVENF